MFNSFLDGTKSAIEMAAVANACELKVPEDGLAFPALRRRRPALPAAAAPSAGGVLERPGMVEVDLLARARRPAGLPRPALGRVRRVRRAVGLHRPLLCRVRPDDQPLRPLRRPLPALPPDRPGARRQRRLGLPARRADRIARLPGAATSPPTAKRDLAAGEMLDGEGGHCVYGRLVPAQPRPGGSTAADRTRERRAPAPAGGRGRSVDASPTSRSILPPRRWPCAPSWSRQLNPALAPRPYSRACRAQRGLPRETGSWR